MTRKTIRILSLISILVLMAVTALGMVSCGKEDAQDAASQAVDSIIDDVSQAADSIIDDASQAADSIIDDAKEVTVKIEVTDDKGEVTSKEYTTKETTLRGVLEENKMIEGTESEYGLMITTVNGIVADYDADGAYWALYKNGEYMMVGADAEILEDGATYGLVYKKG